MTKFLRRFASNFHLGSHSNLKKLGQLLLDFGWIDETQLEQALQTQRVVGGRIGSCLLEVGALDEPMLLRALAHQREVPAARAVDLANVPQEVLGLLPTRIALRSLAVPFRMLGSELYVALLEVTNLDLQDEIAFATGKKVRMHIGNEVRIFTALHRYYGREVSDRFRLLETYLDRHATTVPKRSGFGQHLEQKNSTDDQEVPVPTHPVEAGATSAAQGKIADPLNMKSRWRPRPDAAPSEANSPITEPEASPSQVGDGSSTRDGLDSRKMETVTAPFLPRYESTEAFGAALEEMNDREAMAHSFLEHVRPRFQRVLLYKILPDTAMGWLGVGETIDSKRLANTMIDLERPSIFHDLRNGRAIHVGPLASLSAHQEVVAAFGGEPPQACLFAPIRLGKRLVTVLVGEPARSTDGAEVLEHVELRRQVGEACKVLGIAFGNYVVRQRAHTAQSS